MDIAKFVILETQGGVYCDLDMELLLPLDNLLAGAAVVLAAIFISPGTNLFVINNAFIAVVPGHPLVRKMLAHILGTRWHMSDCLATMRINNHAGPLAWTNQVHHFCRGCLTTDDSWQAHRIRVLPPGTVDLPSAPELRCLFGWVPEVQPHILHHAEGSWRGCCVISMQTCLSFFISGCVHGLVSPDAKKKKNKKNKKKKKKKDNDTR